MKARLTKGGCVMALFGKLFEKKYCAVCGKELGLFGKTKIADGHICSDCSGVLSPHFHAYRSATVDDIKAQMDYREENKQAVAAFNVTRTLGSKTRVFIDEDQGKVIITSVDPSGWASHNPDVFDFSQITGCETEVRETKTEIKRKDAEGNMVSYDPKRYDTDYDIFLTVYFNHPYVEQIEFKVNRDRLESRAVAEFRDAERLANEIKNALAGIRAETRAAAAPKKAVVCPHCLATTIPDANGCCEYCGSSIA